MGQGERLTGRCLRLLGGQLPVDQPLWPWPMGRAARRPPCLTLPYAFALPRREVRSRFPDSPWIDVLSKADMLQVGGGGKGSK